MVGSTFVSVRTSLVIGILFICLLLLSKYCSYPYYKHHCCCFCCWSFGVPFCLNLKITGVRIKSDTILLVNSRRHYSCHIHNIRTHITVFNYFPSCFWSSNISIQFFLVCYSTFLYFFLLITLFLVSWLPYKKTQNYNRVSRNHKVSEKKGESKMVKHEVYK